MKTSDYIVEYLIDKGITDVFGYPGGMVTHLMDSFSKYQNQITVHVTYHEQGAAMAACGYAQVSGKTRVAYATSGPGATNLITGIANAYMDSTPTLFITGQVNSFEQKGNMKVRQRVFQETDIVSMVSPVTKYAVQVNDATKVKYYLDKAFYIANHGRKGSVLLDIAMDVTRTDIDVGGLEGFVPVDEGEKEVDVDKLLPIIHRSKRPVVLIGNGIDRKEREWKKTINSLGIPVVSSMIAVDVQEGLNSFYGFIGAYGDRTANFVFAKSDLVISIGARLDVRQVGAKRDNFAPESTLIRVDIDEGELRYKIRDNEIDIVADACTFLNGILSKWPSSDYSSWLNACNQIKDVLYGHDDRNSNRFVREISKHIPEGSIITTDVGQNQVWVAQSFDVKKGQRILLSGGHGAMGYSLPASIGATIASGNVVYSFNGDGGIQMNIQELQFNAREQLSIKTILFNNNALGMIRHFQEMYFKGDYYHTTPVGGFTSLDLKKLVVAYHMDYWTDKNENDIDDLKDIFTTKKPELIEMLLNLNTFVFPKLEYGKANQDQEPLLDKKLYFDLMNLDGDEEINEIETGGGDWKNKTVILRSIFTIPRLGVVA